MKIISFSMAVVLAALTCVPALSVDYKLPFPPVAAPAGDAPVIYPDFPVELLVTEEQSGGQFSMVVVYLMPGDGPADNLLLEAKLTETYYVLEGSFEFTQGDATFQGGPGTLVVNPPTLPHGYKNVGTTVGKVLVLFSPVDSRSGAGWFVKWAEQSTRSPEWIARKNAEYGIDRPTP